MKIWIVTAFEPIPEDGDQMGRYLALARLASAQGHEVHIFTSLFRHASKTMRSAESRKEVFFSGSINYHKIPVSGYPSNRSWRRILNHIQLSNNISAQLKSKAETYGKPDVAVVACPPNQLALNSVKWFKQHGIPSVLDIHDLWPEAFGIIHPLLGKNGISKKLRTQASHYSDHVVVTCEEYREVVPEGKPCTCIPFGLLKQEQNQETIPTQARLQLIFSGSSEPGDYMLDIFRNISQYPHADTALYIKGDEKGKAAKELSKLEAGNLKIYWNKSQEDVFEAIRKADVGLSIVQKGAPVYFPNKAFEYLASGLMILSNSPMGQLNRWLKKHEAGFAFEQAEKVTQCLDRLIPLKSPEKRNQIRLAAEQDFDRFGLSLQYMSILEKLAK